MYSKKSYWELDAKESIFRNSGAAIFNRDEKTDILNQKWNKRERLQGPAPGDYNNHFSEFSGNP